MWIFSSADVIWYYSTEDTILKESGVCSFCWNLTNIFWVSYFVEFVLGRFSHFNIAIAYSNSNFCGAWTASFCEFTCNFSKTSTPQWSLWYHRHVEEFCTCKKREVFRLKLPITNTVGILYFHFIYRKSNNVIHSSRHFPDKLHPFTLRSQWSFP